MNTEIENWLKFEKANCKNTIREQEKGLKLIEEKLKNATEEDLEWLKGRKEVHKWIINENKKVLKLINEEMKKWLRKR